MNGTLISAQVETVGTRMDGTIKVVLGLQELSPSKGAELLDLRGKVVACYISPKETIPQKELDQVDEADPEFGGKSPSQRMRNVLYVLFEQSPEGFKTFDDFYKAKMEAMIIHFKSKLEPK